MPKEIHRSVDPANEELRQIKARQKARKQAGIPAKVTNDMLYQVGLDILENQARQENMLKELLVNRKAQ